MYISQKGPGSLIFDYYTLLHTSTTSYLFPHIEDSLFCVVLFSYEHYFVWCSLVMSIILCGAV